MLLPSSSLRLLCVVALWNGLPGVGGCYTICWCPEPLLVCLLVAKLVNYVERKLLVLERAGLKL